MSRCDEHRYFNMGFPCPACEWKARAERAEAELLSMGATAAVLMADRDAALARAEKSEKHALRYRGRRRTIRLAFAVEITARKDAEATRDRLRELLREDVAHEGIRHYDWRQDWLQRVRRELEEAK